jgi:hypothetical protein
MTLAQLIAIDIKTTLENSEVPLYSETRFDEEGNPLPSHSSVILSTLSPFIDDNNTDGLKEAIAAFINNAWWPVPHPMRYSEETIAAGAPDTGKIAIWDALKAIQATL